MAAETNIDSTAAMDPRLAEMNVGGQMGVQLAGGTNGERRSDPPFRFLPCTCCAALLSLDLASCQSCSSTSNPAPQSLLPTEGLSCARGTELMDSHGRSCCTVCYALDLSLPSTLMPLVSTRTRQPTFPPPALLPAPGGFNVAGTMVRRQDREPCWISPGSGRRPWRQLQPGTPQWTSRCPSGARKGPVGGAAGDRAAGAMVAPKALGCFLRWHPTQRSLRCGRPKDKGTALPFTVPVGEFVVKTAACKYW